MLFPFSNKKQMSFVQSDFDFITEFNWGAQIIFPTLVKHFQNWPEKLHPHFLKLNFLKKSFRKSDRGVTFTSKHFMFQHEICTSLMKVRYFTQLQLSYN